MPIWNFSDTHSLKALKNKFKCKMKHQKNKYYQLSTLKITELSYTLDGSKGMVVMLSHSQGYCI